MAVYPAWFSKDMPPAPQVIQSSHLCRSRLRPPPDGRAGWRTGGGLRAGLLTPVLQALGMHFCLGPWTVGLEGVVKERKPILVLWAQGDGPVVSSRPSSSHWGFSPPFSLSLGCSQWPSLGWKVWWSCQSHGRPSKLSWFLDALFSHSIVGGK